MGNNSRWHLTSLYNQRRKEFWKGLDMVRTRWNGAWCFAGDRNIIRFPSEKKGGGRLSGGMRSFSDWINSHSLVDLQMSGALFTWSNHESPPIMSRLDRFLVSNEWMDLYPDVFQIALPKPASDHCQIMLNSDCED